MTFSKIVYAFALAVLMPAFLCAAETDAGKSPAAEEGTNAVPEAAEAPADPNFERYRVILDRMPFGPEPANFNPDTPGTRGGASAGDAGELDPAAQEAMKSQEEQKILATVRISALNVTPSGQIAVGFTDSSKQPAGTYYLKVGETRDGWTVKSADARELKATLEKDGVEATLGLGEGGGDSGKDGKKGGKGAGGALRPQLGRLAQAGLLRPAAAQAPGPQGGDAGGSAIANLRARRAQKEAERKEEVARQAAAAEQERADRERAAAEREAERERAAAEREQQRETLLQIQEELRRQREAKEQQQNEEQQAAGQNVQE